MRLYRILHDEDNEQWIVEGDRGQRDTWTEIARFNDKDNARRYILEVQTRQQRLEAKR